MLRRFCFLDHLQRKNILCADAAFHDFSAQIKLRSAYFFFLYKENPILHPTKLHDALPLVTDPHLFITVNVPD